MRINELVENLDSKQKKPYLTKYLRARNYAKKAFGITTSDTTFDPKTFEYSPPESFDWQTNFDQLSEDYDQFLNLLEELSKGVNSEDPEIQQISNLALNLLEKLEKYLSYRGIYSTEKHLPEQFFKRKKSVPQQPPPQQPPYPSDDIALRDLNPPSPEAQEQVERTWAARGNAEYRGMGIRPFNVPHIYGPEQDPRDIKRKTHNEISLDLKNFVYPENLITLIKNSGLASAKI